MIELVVLLVVIAVGAWLFRQVFPVAIGALLVMLAPLWLVLGGLYDLIRWPFLALIRRVKARKQTPD